MEIIERFAKNATAIRAIDPLEYGGERYVAPTAMLRELGINTIHENRFRLFSERFARADSKRIGS